MNKNNIKLTFLIILLISLAIGGTYAFLNFSDNSNTALGTAGCFQVNYSGAVISNLSSNTVQSNETGEVTDLTEGSIANANSTVTLSKASSCKIYTEANIYIHTNEETTAPIEGVQAFKYKITQGSNTIQTGIINKKGDFLLTTVPLTDTALTYNIYLWVDSAISGGAYNYTTFSGNIFAESAQTSTIENSYLVNFNSTGTDLLPERVVTLNQNYGTLPTPSKPGYTFKGWNGKNKFDESKYTQLSDYTIHDSSYKGAKIQLKPNTEYKVSITRYNNFDGKNNGYLLISPSSTINDRWTSIAHNTSPNGSSTNFLYTTGSDGLLYIGYYGVNQAQMDTIWENTDVQIEEGSTATTYEPYYVTNTTKVTQTKNHTLTAIWEPKTYTVTFAANGGSVSPTSKSVSYGEKYGSLPSPTRSGYIFKGWSELPADYQQLEYIESTGTQYINTNIQLFSGTNHEILIDFEPTAFYNYNSLWGTTADADTFEGWIYSNGNLASRFKSVRYGSDNAVTLNTRYNYKLIKEGTTLYKYLNGNQIGTGTVTSTLTSAQQSSYFLLLLSGSDYGKYKVYSTKLYRDGTLVRDFIPCYKISTGKAGLYDKVNDVFYPNTNTSGDDFIKGDRKYITSNSPVTQSSNHTLTAVWEEN